MSRPEDPRDPVAELFAREREAVVPGHADDLRWQGIVREARRGRRAHTAGYAAGLAAAVAVAAGGVLLATNLTAPEDSTQVAAQREAAATPSRGPETPAATSPSGQEDTSAAPSASPDRPAATATVGTRAVPAEFRITSMSTAGGGVVYALGASDCGSARCPTLVGSADDGRTWRLVKAFPRFAAAAEATTDSQTAVPPATALTQVRFADPRVGWVFGGGAQVTRDGGRTWAELDHPGEVVLDLEAKAGRVYLAAASGCSTNRCDDGFDVSSAPVAASGTTSLRRADEPGAAAGPGLVAADVELTGRVPYVNARPAAGGRPLTPRRVDGSVHAPVGAERSGRSVLAVFGAADGSDVVFGVTVVDGADVLLRSGDGGRTWAPAGGPVALAGPVRSYAAASGRELVGVAGRGGGGGGGGSVVGGAKPVDTVLVSHDGGATWTAPDRPPSTSAAGWRWVGAAGAGTYYALAHDAERAYWRSTDFGRTWVKVTLR